jgi:hypothetical protein
MLRTSSVLRNCRVAITGLPLVIVVLILGFTFNGCKTSAHSSDPRMRKIDGMLDAELPKGTSIERVRFFLNTRGYRVLSSDNPRTVVAIVRHIDTDTLRPDTARVTFHFDPSERLASYELAPAPDEPSQP